MNSKDGECANLSRSSQGSTALMYFAIGGHTACVKALSAAKACIDIQNVSYARSFIRCVTLESPSASKPHKHPLKSMCAVLCACVRTVVSLASLCISGDCALTLCLYAH